MSNNGEMGSATVLEVNNLKKYYPSVKAVDDISFEVNAGEIVSILGPNGAGKTTTIEIIEGLRTKDEGEISYFGRFKEVNNEVKNRVGVCFQENSFFEDLTVSETIRLYKSLYEKSLDTKELIEIFELEEKVKTRIRHLSGGQKQRLAVALAFVNDPDLVFLDEPTVGLDPHARRNLWEIILKFKSQGKGIVLTTHYMDEAQQLSDKVYIMDHGNIITAGSPQELINSSGLESVIEFPEESSALFEDVIIAGEYAYLHTRDTVSAIRKLLESNVTNFVVRQPTLEDVFLKLTGKKID
ncbi:MAG TPA: ABC transporter ATP-binding protein [Fervidobacterium sp.]|nr:ABC transporter ATP-binding protein [Fervidobacterium sp.]HPT54453.1 ABC transporter ATP-binding protein [Fervidobacterium sp.]HPZ17831.1 ABC transporter ATP-binding protein [Fervidobacterium sp.]HQE48900.1 ABC transporter ATP-binding protein [Fervidobacterium sp.]HUM42778.1 ABC transporter ATP-binding protein [Fervidobacterium sp.]